MPNAEIEQKRMSNEESGYGDAPLVSVIMNGYNAERYLREALDSVLAQSYQNWEIILWDNISVDGTAAIVASYADPRIRYFLAEKFTPLGEARNLAIKRARGELIAFLDCDDVWLPEKLAKQVPLFSADPEVGLVICDTLFFNENGLEKQLYKKRKPPQGSVFRELLSDYFVSLETSVVRKAALDALDTWFDERFNVIEEYDLFVRVGYKWRVGFVDEVLAKWRVHSSSWTWTKAELFPVETKLFLESLAEQIPNFYGDYADEIAAVKRKIAWQEAHIEWRAGKTQRARDILSKHCKDSKLFLFLTLLTFLPYTWFLALYRLSGRIRP